MNTNRNWKRKPPPERDGEGKGEGVEAGGRRDKKRKKDGQANKQTEHRREAITQRYNTVETVGSQKMEHVLRDS